MFDILDTLKVSALQIRNAANTFVNSIANATTAARTWTFPDKTGTVALVSDITDIASNIKDPNGWIDPTAITSTYNSANRTVTLTGTLDYYWRGVKYSLTSPWTSSAHSSADGSYFLYSTDGTTFSWSTTPWEMYHLMVSYVTKSTSPAYNFAIIETHGCMDWRVHDELHRNIGTNRKSGGGLTAGTYALNTATDAANTPGFDSAIVVDEDIQTTVSAWTEGTYTTMRVGSGGLVTFDTTATLPFRSGGSYIYINNPSTGAETAGVTGKYYNVYQVLIPTASDSNSQKYRVCLLQPQVEYPSLANAQAENISTLNLGNLTSLATEFVIYARLTYATSASNANTGKVTLASVTYVIGTRVNNASVASIANIDLGTQVSGVLAEANGGTGVSSLLSFVLTGLSAAAGTLAATDTILQAFNKIAGLIDNDPWTAWTPTYDGNFTLGNGSQTGKYKKLMGKTIVWSLDITFGSTTSVTAGQSIRFQLPVAPRARGTWWEAGTGNASIGLYKLAANYQPGTGYATISAVIATTTAASGTWYIMEGGAGSTFPGYVNGSIITLQGTYEAA